MRVSERDLDVTGKDKEYVDYPSRIVIMLHAVMNKINWSY